MPEYRRILLDGISRPGQCATATLLVAADGREVGVEEAQHLPPSEPTKIIAVHLNYDSRTQEFMTRLPAAPTYFHKPITALNSHKGAVVRPAGLQVAELRGRDRDRHRAHLPQRLARGGRRLHRRLHDRQRLRPARLPRHRRRLDAAREGLRHPGAGRPGPRDRLGLPRQDSADAASTARSSRRAPPTRWSGTCTTSSPTSRARSRSSPGDLLFSGTPANSRPVEPGDVVEVEVEGLGKLTNHIVVGPTPIRTDVGAQPTESEEVVSTALGGDWEYRGIRTPSKDLYPSTVEDRS